MGSHADKSIFSNSALRYCSPAFLQNSTEVTLKIITSCDNGGKI